MQEDKVVYQMRFPQKLWYLINLGTDAVLWGSTGRTILLNYKILHDYLQCDNAVFKTNNISSFVRQLNLYGFRKVTSHLQDPLCNSSNPFLHEYMHDYFQYGRPHLLDKIIRKALNIKKKIKHKSFILSDLSQTECLTPLQIARRAFRLALRNAAQQFYLQHSAPLHGYDDSVEDSCEDEEFADVDELKPYPTNNELNNITKDDTQLKGKEAIGQKSKNFEEINYSIENYECKIKQELSESIDDTIPLPTQFLSMPTLDPEPVGTTNNGIEILGEFHVNNDNDEGITKKVSNCKELKHYLGSLNCVLPSICSEYQQDDVIENNMTSDNGDWDFMFKDILNKGQTQECGSEFKDLYSQISRTIDLLNT